MEPNPEEPAAPPSQDQSAVPSCYLTLLPKELRLEMIVSALKPSVKATPSSDELIIRRDFERRCAQFVEMPMLQACKLLREEGTPIVKRAMKALIAELQTVRKEWSDISEAYGGVDVSMPALQIDHKLDLEEECLTWSDFCVVAQHTLLAWILGRRGSRVATMVNALCGQDSRVVRRYRKEGDDASGDMHERVQSVVDWDEANGIFARLEPEHLERLLEKSPALRENLRLPPPESEETGAASPVASSLGQGATVPGSDAA